MSFSNIQKVLTSLIVFSILIIPLGDQTVFGQSPAPGCPDGSIYNNTTDLCEAGATCPEGDVTLDQCIETVDGICLEGFPNFTTDVCDGDLPNIGPITCPDGFTYSNANDVCEDFSDPICPNGTTYNNATDLCEAGATCPEGTTLVNDWCEGPPMAVAGELLPTNSVALIVAGLSSMVWGVTAMAGVIVVGVVGAGIYLVIFKPHNN